MPNILLWLCIVAFSSFTTSISAEPIQQSEFTTIYLIRHAEKETAKPNPKLNQCGKKRALSLAKQFELIGVSKVFSTDYNRTKSTASPMATQKQLDINLYDPRNLESFADQLKTMKGTIVVLGHSNTTSILAGLLIDKTLLAFDESIYDRLYQVTMLNGQGKLQILQQNFSCHK